MASVFDLEGSNGESTSLGSTKTKASGMSGESLTEEKEVKIVSSGSSDWSSPNENLKVVVTTTSVYDNGRGNKDIKETVEVTDIPSDTVTAKRSAFFSRYGASNINTIPTIRGMLQDRAKLSGSLFDLEKASSYNDEALVSIAAKRYGSLDVSTAAAVDREFNEAWLKGIMGALVMSSGTVGTSLNDSGGVGGNKAATDEEKSEFQKVAREAYLAIVNKSGLADVDQELYTRITDPNMDVKGLVGELVDSAANDLKSLANGLVAAVKKMTDGVLDPGRAIIESYFPNGLFDFSPIDGTKKLALKGLKYFAGKLIDSDELNNLSKNSFGNVRNKVMCLAPGMNPIIDPQGRCYANNVLATQHIVSIIPGDVSYTGISLAKTFGIGEASLKTEIDQWMNGTASLITMDSHSSLLQLVDLLRNKKARLGTFAPNIGAFMSIYNLIMARFKARLSPRSGIGLVNEGFGSKNNEVAKTFSNKLYTSGWGGFQFALNSNTTVTESGSNSWEDSPIEGIRDTIKSIGTKISSSVATMLGSENGQTAQQQMNFPKHWTRSDFSRSYTLNFRLESPYGSTEHLLEYVYKPLAVILTMSLPVYRDQFNMTSPFAIRVDCPGWFTVDTGYVTSVDIRRGSDENSWSAQGMATSVEVNMTIADMYNSLGLSVGPNSLGHNFELQGYLDNICGMDYKEIYTGGSFSSALRTYAAYARTIPDTAVASLKAKANEKIWKFPGSLFDTNANR